MSLEDLEYTGDLVLLSHSFNHVLEKTRCLEKVAVLMGLRIDEDKTKSMRVKTASLQRDVLANGAIDECSGGVQRQSRYASGKVRLTLHAMDRL